MSKIDMLTRKLNYAQINSNISNNTSNLVVGGVLDSANCSSANNTSAMSSATTTTNNINKMNNCNNNSKLTNEKNSAKCAILNNNECNKKSQINGINSNDLSNFNLKSSDNYFELANVDPDFEYKGYHKFNRILGRGSFGTVVECERKKDKKLVALKFFKYKGIHKWISEDLVTDYLDESIIKQSEFFSKENISANLNRMLPLEVACLVRASKMPSVIKIVDYIPCVHSKQTNNDHIESGACCSDASHANEDSIIGIVLERDSSEICLFDYLYQTGKLSEDEARVIMKQIIYACLNLLQLGILHGDLKSENILIEPKSKKIKLIDFGSAQILDPSIANHHHNNHHHHHHHNHNGQQHHHNGHHSLNKCSFHSNQKCNTQSLLTKPVRTFRGTNLYKPPEFILHHCFYPRPSTVWTFGIILFDLVCGHFPFDNDSDVLTHQDKDILFSRNDLSNDFKDLIRKCLAFYVAERIVIEKILTHPWMMK